MADREYAVSALKGLYHAIEVLASDMAPFAHEVEIKQCLDQVRLDIEDFEYGRDDDKSSDKPGSEKLPGDE